MTPRDKRVERAQLRVIFRVRFFAPGILRLPVVWDSQVKTAQTDGKVIKWNPAFFDALKDEEVTTVLCHEVLHPLLGHLWRMPPGGNFQRFNHACDHAVNLMLKEFSAVVTAKHLADPFPFPEKFPPLADPQYAGLAEEQIYARLPDEPYGPGMGDFEIDPKADPADAKKQKIDWERILIQSAELAKGRGDLPGNIERLVNDLTNPQLPWWELLAQWLREQANDDWCFTRPNRFYGESEFILPVLESERIGPIVFATDTSGSIDADTLSHFQAEKQSVLDDLRPSRLLDIYCDAKIQKVKEYAPGETIERDAPGGGGTDFRPVFQHVEKLNETPKCLVYLTDLDGVFPDAPPEYPVIFVTWSEGRQAPFGETIYARS